MSFPTIRGLLEITVYMGTGIPKVYQEKNYPMLAVQETSNGGLVIWAVPEGRTGPVVVSRVAAGKWDHFDLTYLPVPPVVGVKPKKVAPAAVDLETTVMTAHVADKIPPRGHERAEQLAETTVPLPKVPSDPSTVSFPVVIHTTEQEDGGVRPFLPTDPPVLSQDLPLLGHERARAIQNFVLDNAEYIRQAEEVRIEHLKRHMERQGISPYGQGRAASQEGVGQPSSD